MLKLADKLTTFLVAVAAFLILLGTLGATRRRNRDMKDYIKTSKRMKDAPRFDDPDTAAEWLRERQRLRNLR